MKKLLMIVVVSLFPPIVSHAEELSYSGRLVNANGSPVTGLVDLRFDVAYSGTPTATICSKTVSGVTLTNGVFHASLDIENSDCTPTKAFTAVLRDVPTAESVVLQVTDLTNSKVYPYQAFKSVPLSIHANSAKTLSIAGTNGQILKLVAGEWVAADGGGVGSVTEVDTGSGLSGGPITSSGTISISNNGVTSTHIADGTITNVDINATAAIARSKIASGTANHVVINDGAGVLSSVAQLPLSAGGTGAANASDARDNLGLGNSATRDVGLNTGNVLLADEVPSCLSHQKIQKTVLAPYIFSCVADNDSADSTKLPLAGGTMEGAINMGGFAITNLLDPVNAQDAATRNYVHTYVASELLGVSESQWVDSGSDIYFSAGNVGIGTSTPGKLLEVSGDILVNGVTIGRGGGNDSLNTAVGTHALNSNTGNYNSAFGYFAASSNTSATSNTSVGFSALGGITVGSYNTAIGRDSGLYIADGATANQTSSSSVYLGSFTKALVDGGTNEIVIGYNTIGNGSNSATLGNDLITKTILKGNVGIGTNNPGAKLEVAGQVKITGGSPGAGKVLTSDGAGLATWETPSAPTSGSINSSHILDGSIVDADINASAAIAQSKIANLTTDLASKQASDPDLAALAALSSFGILVRDSSNSFVTRTLMGAAGRITVANANGAGGNPTINISNGLLPSPVTGDAGKFLKATGADTSAWSALASGDITTALGFTPVDKAGDTISSGTFTFNGTSVVNVPTPTAATHAATKSYVDSAVTSSSLWTLSGSDVYRSAGNVGVGTATPQVKLSLGGSFYSNTASQIHIVDPSSVSRVALGEDNNNHGEMTWHDLFDAMIFNTKRAGTTYTNNLVLKDGKVGIGTTAPARLLDLQTSLTGDGIRVTNSHATGSTAVSAFGGSNNIMIVNWATGDSNYLASTNASGLKIQSSAHTIFQTNGATERMRITAAGDVGIGVVAPGAKLDINGQIKISGGTPGLGKVLTSDAAGLASWQTPAAGGMTALTGDVTASGSGSVTATIANNAVTSAKILDGTIVDADINASAAIAQSKIANLTTDLAAKQASDPELTAVAGLTTNGIIVKTGAGAVTTRSILQTAGRTTITNGDGISGNITVDVNTSLLPTPASSGSFLKSTGAGTSSWQTLASGDITTALGFTPLNKAGDTISSGALTINGTGAIAITNTPVSLTDAVNKQYVDTAVAGANLWTLGSGNVYRTTGNVGVGTASPAGKLHVESATDTNFVLATTNTANSAQIEFRRGANSVWLGPTPSSFDIWADESTPMLFGIGGSERMRITSTGRVGIGNTSPATDLQVGTTAANGEVRLGKISFNSNTANSIEESFGIRFNLSSNTSASAFRIFNTSTELVRVNGDGNVGVGTASPEAKLDVNGTASMSASTESISTYVNSTATYTIPNASVNIRRITLTANTVITLPAFTSATPKVYTITVFVKQDATGNRSASFLGNGSDTVKWDTGFASSISTTAGKITILQFTKPSDETVWYGSKVWQED